MIEIVEKSMEGCKNAIKAEGRVHIHKGGRGKGSDEKGWRKIW